MDIGKTESYSLSASAEVLSEVQDAIAKLHIYVYQSLIDVLCHSNCYGDAVALLTTACQQFQDHSAVDSLRDALMKCERLLQEWESANGASSASAKCCGRYVRWPYPWIDERHLL